jgi:succinate dehydrogenase/fumarate reductase flavoprotein subunit
MRAAVLRSLLLRQGVRVVSVFVPNLQHISLTLHQVLLVDKCPAEWVGGNGYFTAGAHRTVHQGLQDILTVVRNVSQETADKIDMAPYSHDDFVSDIMRLGSGKSDRSLVNALVDNSRQTIAWLATHVGVPFTLSFNRQAYEVNGRHKFWGGMVLSVEEGGKGLITAHQRALKRAGVETWFDTPAISLVAKDGAIRGLVVRKDGQELELTTSSVILAAGGFEANASLRAKHLGSGWELARVFPLYDVITPY